MAQTELVEILNNVQNSERRRFQRHRAAAERTSLTPEVDELNNILWIACRILGCEPEDISPPFPQHERPAASQTSRVAGVGARSRGVTGRKRRELMTQRLHLILPATSLVPQSVNNSAVRWQASITALACPYSLHRLKHCTPPPASTPPCKTCCMPRSQS